MQTNWISQLKISVIWSIGVCDDIVSLYVLGVKRDKMLADDTQTIHDIDSARSEQ